MRHTICETKVQNLNTYNKISRKQASKLKTATHCFKTMILIFFGHHLASFNFAELACLNLSNIDTAKSRYKN